MIPDPTLEALERRLDGPIGGWRIASVPWHGDPLALVQAGSSRVGTAVYLRHPDDLELGGLGVAWRSAAAGAERLTELAERVATLPMSEATVLVGCSFSERGGEGHEWAGFPSATAVLPMVEARRGSLTVVLPPDRPPTAALRLLRGLPVPRPGPLPRGRIAEEYPPRAAWEGTVAKVLEAIRAGDLRKVVLARSVMVWGSSRYLPFDLVDRLRGEHPGCLVFGWQEGEAGFVGASPELLVERRGAWVRTLPLAGSAARGRGPADDRRLADRLLVGEKELAEHAFTVSEVVSGLGRLVTQLQVPPRPSVVRTSTVQHLGTEISGRLTTPHSVLELAAALHPTPAVGGVPRESALAFIEKEEGLDRGWYTGGLGWTDKGGDGRLAVALRCGLVRGRSVRLFAGAGLVTGSDPEAELEEINLKLRPLLDLLT